MSGPRLPEPEAVPEAEADTAARRAAVIRSRRARGGRARLILDNTRADAAATAGAAPRAPGGFGSALEGRGRYKLVGG